MGSVATEPLWPARFDLTPFFGRQAEISEVVRLLTEARLVTVIGAPGAGKTRLALKVADLAGARFRDGVRLISLAGVSEADLVQTVADGLGVRNERATRLTNSIVSALRASGMLVLLDNCEHVAPAVADLVALILTNCSSIRILATSRVPLEVPGERLHRVPPLDPASAADLFVDRAARVTDLVLDAAGWAAVERICERLDGLPLAIELAARQTRVLSLDEVPAHLETELARATDPGQAGFGPRTMAAAIAGSCRLLSTGQNDLLASLSVFVGPFDLRAAEAVAGPAPQVLSDLTALVDHSLALAEPAGSGVMHYRMLEPIRQFAAARLDGRGDTNAIRERHAGYYLQIVDRAARNLMGVGGHRWYDELRAAEPNVLAAVAWARGLSSDLALRLVTCLSGYWEHRGYINESRGHIETLLDHGVPSPRARAEALLALCTFGYRQGRYTESLESVAEVLTLMRGLGDDDGVARALRTRGMLAAGLGDAALAIESCERSAEIFAALGDRQAQAWTYTVLGLAHYVAGDLERGAAADVTALQLLRSAGEAPAVSRRAHIGLTFAAAGRGDTAAHRRHLEDSIADLRLLGALDGEAEWLWSAVTLASDEGRMTAAMRLVGAARTRERRGNVLPPVAEVVARKAVAAAETALGPRATRRLLTEGATLTTDETVDVALAVPSVDDSPLSAREWEIAQLTGQGLTNAEIARRLVISRRTVESHQEHIRDKLQLGSRFEVMAWALAERSAGSGPAEESG